MSLRDPLPRTSHNLPFLRRNVLVLCVKRGLGSFPFLRSARCQYLVLIPGKHQGQPTWVRCLCFHRYYFRSEKRECGTTKQICSGFRSCTLGQMKMLLGVSFGSLLFSDRRPFWRQAYLISIVRDCFTATSHRGIQQTQQSRLALSVHMSLVSSSQSGKPRTELAMEADSVC